MCHYNHALSHAEKLCRLFDFKICPIKLVKGVIQKFQIFVEVDSTPLLLKGEIDSSVESKEPF